MLTTTKELQLQGAGRGPVRAIAWDPWASYAPMYTGSPKGGWLPRNNPPNRLLPFAHARLCRLGQVPAPMGLNRGLPRKHRRADVHARSRRSNVNRRPLPASSPLSIQDHHPSICPVVPFRPVAAVHHRRSRRRRRRRRRCRRSRRVPNACCTGLPCRPRRRIDRDSQPARARESESHSSVRAPLHSI